MKYRNSHNLRRFSCGFVQIFMFYPQPRCRPAGILGRRYFSPISAASARPIAGETVSLRKEEIIGESEVSRKISIDLRIRGYSGALLENNNNLLQPTPQHCAFITG